MVARPDVMLELYGGALGLQVATRENCNVIRKNVGLEVVKIVSMCRSIMVETAQGQKGGVAEKY